MCGAYSAAESLSRLSSLSQLPQNSGPTLTSDSFPNYAQNAKPQTKVTARDDMLSIRLQLRVVVEDVAEAVGVRRMMLVSRTSSCSKRRRNTDSHLFLGRPDLALSSYSSESIPPSKNYKICERSSYQAHRLPPFDLCRAASRNLRGSFL